MLPTVLENMAQNIFLELEGHLAAPIYIVMRGLPGSGKSSVSKRVQELMQGLNLQVVRICTDEILEMCEGGYHWDGYKMPLYHGVAHKISYLATKNDVPVIILDNTNMKKKEYEGYVIDARQKGYSIWEYTIGGFSEEDIENSFNRNSHSVPMEAIRRMAARYQE